MIVNYLSYDVTIFVLNYYHGHLLLIDRFHNTITMSLKCFLEKKIPLKRKLIEDACTFPPTIDPSLL
jgi:hypothetical protein